MDSPRSVQPIPSSGSISSKEVSKVFSAQVEVSTSSQHQVHVLALLDTGANSCFMDREFALAQKISLHKLPYQASVVVIDGRPIASGNITEGSEPVRVVLDDLACVISFNIISSPEHPIVLGLPWFELHKLSIDWQKQTIRCQSQGKKEIQMLEDGNVKAKYRKISTISLQQLRKEGRKEEMFVFAISTKPFKESEGSSKIKLPHKYKEFADVFDKVKVGILLEHRPYDCPIDLQPVKEPPWGPIYNLSPTKLEVLREYIDENLANGFIRHSKSPAGAPIFFVKKKDASLRLVVDY